MVTSYVETAFYNKLLKDKGADRSDKKTRKKALRSYWMTLRTREDTVN